MGDPYRLVERLPTLEEYTRICVDVGWGDIVNFDAARTSLPASRCAFVAELGDDAVGMGRVVGDGAIYFYVQDVAVLHAHQGRGLGGRILGALVDWVGRNAPEQAFVGLFAAVGTEGFYRRFGFEAHTGMTGMFQVTPRPR
jgi:GNAT superfamily N-acetyltransferase